MSLSISPNSAVSLDVQYSYLAREKENLKAYSVFLEQLKLLITNDSALQEHYKKPTESSIPEKDPILSSLDVVSRIRQRLSVYIERYTFGQFLMEWISLRAQKIRQSRGNPQTDIEHAQIKDLYQAIQDFEIYGFDIDMIQLFAPSYGTITIRNASQHARETFRKMKPILLSKAI